MVAIRFVGLVGDRVSCYSSLRTASKKTLPAKGRRAFDIVAGVCTLIQVHIMSMAKTNDVVTNGMISVNHGQ